MTRPKDARAAMVYMLDIAKFSQDDITAVLDTYANAVRAQAIDDVLNALAPVTAAVEATTDAGARLALAWVIERILAQKEDARARS